MRRFNGPMLESMMTTLRVPDDQPIESKMVSRAIRSAQTQVEAQNFEVRKDVLKYDEVLNRQRTVIYGERRKVLEGADLHVQIQSMIDDVIGAYVDGATETGYPEDWDLELLWTGLKALYPVRLDRADLLERVADGDQAALSAGALKEELLADVHRAYDEREETLGSEVMRELERRVLLSVLDRKWREHLYEMDYLRAGIHLRAMANRDPVVEYQREGFDMFKAMLDGIKEESVGFLFNLEVKSQEEQEAEAAAQQAEAEAAALAAAQEGTARVLARQAAETQAQATAAAQAAPPRATARKSAAAQTPAVQATTPSGTGPHLAVKGLDEPRPAENLQYSAPTLDASTKESGPAKAAKSATVTGTQETPRNAPCPCGSGKKYKQCHGAAGR
jgi:preprotein translocase subunit SecA